MSSLDSYSLALLQNFRSLVSQLRNDEITDLTDIENLITSKLSNYNIKVTPDVRKLPDNITTCSVCGKSAVIVSLGRADRTKTATHAIQCQNRPATDQPWRNGMCGHTEYIVRGDK